MPAAWPIAMHVPIERAEAWASCVAEKQRPATSTFSSPCGCSARNGMPYVDPSARYTHRVSSPAWCSSIGAPQRATWSGNCVAARISSAVRTCSPTMRRLSRTPIAGLVALVAGDVLAEEPEVLVRLAAALALGRGELVGVGRVDVPDTRHQRHHHALVRRTVHGALDPRQRVATRIPRLAHPLPELLLRHGLGALDVDVRHPEDSRETLHALARRLERRAGERADVRVAARVDDDGRPQPAHAALRGDVDTGDATALDRDTEREGVQERPHAGLLRQLVPDALERLGVIGNARAGAVRVRPLEGHSALDQPRDDLVRDAGDDLLGALARRVEGVERVEHRGRRPAEEAKAVDEQRPRTRPRGRDRGRRPGRARSDDEHVVALFAHLCKSMHE